MCVLVQSPQHVDGPLEVRRHHSRTEHLPDACVAQEMVDDGRFVAEWQGSRELELAFLVVTNGVLQVVDESHLPIVVERYAVLVVSLALNARRINVNFDSWKVSW